ncbi:DUF2799 domain-containing protein [Albimonas sp. CAU 1670]|uniref:DUF2799 domain-containing protein n=1 Tax=Albimonas sp. CAU 1670 TaxID=3032599 RepID=UPI0023DA36B6|nr:DUF2799 domain-containing protein [Albimonas sp. CAU 1670]MDF2232857.1 DUF2799 domain-containing protein [Albimonas sp. CAU 1670]
MMTAIRLPRLRRGPLALIVAGLLAACSSAPPAERAAVSPTAGDCAAVDWNRQGVEDAMAGRSPTSGLARLSGCPRLADADAAQDDYMAGHDEGRAAYCSPANGAQLGRWRVAPTLDCPAALNGPFQAAYAEGLSQPAETPPEPEAQVAEGDRAPVRLRPYLSVGVGSGGWSGVSWGIGLLF